MLNADTLARCVAALQAKQPDAAVAAVTPLSAASSDAVLLAAHRSDPQLLRRLRAEAEAAYHAARGAPGCDWRDLDMTWHRFICDLQRAAVLPPDAPENGVMHHAQRAAALRAALCVRQTFLDKAVPEMTVADRLANQPVSTVVHAHRLAARGGPHPMEPTFASPPTTED